MFVFEFVSDLSASAVTSLSSVLFCSEYFVGPSPASGTAPTHRSRPEFVTSRHIDGFIESFIQQAGPRSSASHCMLTHDNV